MSRLPAACHLCIDLFEICCSGCLYLETPAVHPVIPIADAATQVFHQSSASSQEDASWKESLYRMYATSSANMRVAVYGAKHDAAPYEELLRKFCAVQELVRG